MAIKNPKTCLLTVTNSCVLRCKMCQLWQADTVQNEISISDCKRFVDSLGQFGPDPIEVHLIGGESLIKEGIFELIRYINDKGSRTVVTSSGYTIDESKAKALVESGLGMLNLSLESLNPQVHDFLRGRQGCLDRIIAAINIFERIGRGKMRLGLNSIISGANLEDILELTEWVQEKDCLDSIYFMAVMRPFGSGLQWDWFKKEECKFLWPQDIKRTEIIIDTLIALKKKGYKIENPVGQLEAFKAYFEDPFKFIKIKRCNVSEQAININALGDAYICFFMEKLGNIKTENIAELWHSQKAEQIRRRMQECRNNCELVINCYYKDDDR